jgi:ferrochelatase
MKNALLLINLGTPNSTDTQAIRQYLREFLSDPRVIDLPAPLRYALLYAVILPFRPKRLTHAYRSIWTEQGSPLLVHSLALEKKLQARLPDCQVVLGMRYGLPSLEDAFKKIGQVENLCILPLYPQYSSAATGSSIEKCLRLLSHSVTFPSLRIIRDFHQHPSFIKAQAELIRPQLQEHDFLLLSYHGIPQKHLSRAGCQRLCQNACPNANHEETTKIETKQPDCYKAQCYATTAALAKTLDLAPGYYTSSFQSRLGKTPWIKPFTDEVLQELRQKGIKRLLVACPSFVADCLETEEEIGIRAKEQWLQLGGETLTLVPSLNASDHWVEAIVDLYINNDIPIR